MAAASSGSEEYDTDPVREASAYNNSIYLMVFTPYISLAVVTFLIYRGVKKNEAFRRARGLAQDPGLAPPDPAA